MFYWERQERQNMWEKGLCCMQWLSSHNGELHLPHPFLLICLMHWDNDSTMQGNKPLINSLSKN